MKNSEQVNQHFTILTLGWNTKQWVRKCIESALGQNYDNFDIIAVDAMTDDGTYDILKEYEDRPNFKLFRREHRCFQLENTKFGVEKSRPDTVIITLDFDDWFADENVLSKVNEVYNENVWMTYGTYIEYFEDKGLKSLSDPDGANLDEGFFYRYSDDVVNNNKFRDERWMATHLRTFRKELFMKIKEKDFFDPETNEYYSMAGDFAFMFPMIEMCGERFEYIPEELYVHNRSNEMSETKVDLLNEGQPGHIRQYATGDRIRLNERYQRLETL